MSNHSRMTSGISDDAEKRDVNSNSVGAEAEVERPSAGVTSSPSTEIRGNLACGTIVDVLPSKPAAEHHHTSASDELAAREMGNAINKQAKPDRNTAAPVSSVKPGVTQAPVTNENRIPDHSTGSEAVSIHPSSGAAELPTDVDGRTSNSETPDSDGNPEISSAENDVARIDRDADARVELSMTPLTSLLEGTTSTPSDSGVVEPSDVGLDSDNKGPVSVSKNGPQLSMNSTDIRCEVEGTPSFEGDTHSDTVRTGNAHMDYNNSLRDNDITTAHAMDDEQISVPTSEEQIEPEQEFDLDVAYETATAEHSSSEANTSQLTNGMSGGDGTSGSSRNVGGLTKLRRRLSAALSHVDFEHCDPPTCISVLQVASIQVAYIKNSSAVFILPQYSRKLEGPHSRSHRPL